MIGDALELVASPGQSLSAAVRFEIMYGNFKPLDYVSQKIFFVLTCVYIYLIKLNTLGSPLTSVWREQEAIQQLLAGDKQAFSNLYDRYSDALYGLILNIVVNEADAENLLQSIESPNPEMAKIDFIGLDSLLEKLKPEQREIIDLIYFQGLTQQEVSDELQLPLGTVKSRCRSAILHLRTVLEIN